MKSKGTILNFAVDVGVELLNCGAEIQRVEETMTRILSAYGCNDAEVSATPVNIIATVSDNSLPLTKSARIKYRDTNLYRLEQLNALSRRICETKPDILMARKQLAKIKEEKGSGVFVQISAFAAVGLSYAIFFGGTAGDIVTALVAAAMTRILLYLLDRQRYNIFFKSILSATLIAFVTLIAEMTGFSHNPESAMTGALMTLVPGIALTNCMRDFMAEDYLSGMSGLAEAILTAFGIAIGVSVMFFAKGAVL